MWWKVIELLWRFLGLAEMAAKAYKRHQAWKAQNVKTTVLTDDDDTIDHKLRDSYTRD
jgi:hypothetical protein